MKTAIISKQKIKLTADDLRFLLENVDKLDDELNSFRNEIALEPDSFNQLKSPIFWSHFYELDFYQFVALAIISFDATDDLKKVVDDGYRVGLTNLSNSILKNLDNQYSCAKSDEALIVAQNAMCVGFVMMLCVKSMMVYGYYLNDLIKIARDNKASRKGDDALLKAIRIDPSIVACPTAASRISYAVLMDDTKFIKKMQNALTGKLGTRDSKNYQKMRFVLQALYEAGAYSLNDNDLIELFVRKLNIYSDTQNTAGKNLQEFAYKFKNQKSTI
jgi:hypothetical protein